MTDERGRLGWANLLESSKTLVPEDAWIEGDNLLYTIEWQNRDPAGMLDAFLRIEDAADVLKFAGRFGVLALCEHGVPFTHNPPGGFGSSEHGCYFSFHPTLYRVAQEPIARWLFWVQDAKKIIELAARIGQNADSEPESDRILVALEIDDWLRYGAVRPSIEWRGESPSLSFEAWPFGLLALQMLFAVAGAAQVALCDGCGKPYLPRRKPRPDQRHFCTHCGERGAARLRRQDWASKRKKGISDD
jgi:hypothetical protein